ncbi:MAG: VanZ family protein [Fimbriimonadaceae bacterium]
MRLRAAAPALLWALVIFLTSSTYIPSKTFVHVAVTRAGIGMLAGESAFTAFWKSWWWVFVKGYHVLEYVLLTALVYRAVRAVASGARAIGWAGLIALAYAASDEFHQTFVKDRGGKWTDVAIDGIGITLVVVWLLVARSRASR